MPPISYSTFIDAPQDRVYTELTTGEGWDHWFTTKARIDARPGGTYSFIWKNFGGDRETLELTGPVLEAEPNKAFSFRWGSGEGMTTVKFTLEPMGGGTLLRVTESGYSYSERDVTSCLNCACGWGEALTLLKFYLEHGVTYGEVPEATARSLRGGTGERG
jgi:uncharacterized protein YndB with AHSA1/START domain